MNQQTNILLIAVVVAIVAVTSVFVVLQRGGGNTAPTPTPVASQAILARKPGHRYPKPSVTDSGDPLRGGDRGASIAACADTGPANIL
jgi:hypothetical protein